MTLMWVQILMVVLTLALIGWLTRSAVLFANLAISVGVSATGALKGGCKMPIQLMVAALRRALHRLRSEPATALALLAATLGFAWYVTLAILFPPVGYDDFAYHLPGAALLLQNHSLTLSVLPPRLLAMNCFPQISEFLSVWCFSLFGTDSMIIVWQIGIYIQFVVACVVLCRSCGCTRTSSLFGLCLRAVTPTLLAQMLTSYNDVCVAAFFAGALAFAVIAGRDPRRMNLIGLALSCGALLACKLSMPLLVCVALAIFIIQSAINRRASAELMRPLTFVLVIVVVVGGYWYIRNLLYYGNPLYPFKIQFAGISLPGAAMPLSPTFLNPELGPLSLFERLWRLWLEQKSHYGYWFYSYESAYSGFGPIWFVIGVPSVIAAILLSLGKQRWITLAILSLTTAAYLGFQGNMSVRYTLFILPIMILSVAVTTDQMRQKWNDRAGKIQITVAGWGFLTVQWLGILLIAFTVGLMLFAIKGPDLIAKQILASSILKVAPESPVLGAFTSVRNMISRKSVVVFDETVDFIYPLWRPDFANTVRFVSSAQPLDRWSKVVSDLQARYVFAKLGPAIPTDAQSPLAGWIALHPSNFRLVARAGVFGELYEVQ